MRALHLNKLMTRLRAQTAVRTCKPALAAPTITPRSGRGFSAASGKLHGILFRTHIRPLAAGLVAGTGCGATAAYTLIPSLRAPEAPALVATSRVAGPASSTQSGPAWVHKLAARSGILEVLNAETLRSHSHPLLSEDHMFSALLRHNMVQNLTCFYDPGVRNFFSVMELGSDICGYRRIVHGGLTAAICDETLGGLLMALRRQKLLPFWGPAFTAQLDITYLGKVPSSSTILCTAEVESIEGRKVWMRAVVSHGPEGKVLATARALFVAPKPSRLLREGIRTLFPSWQFGRKE